ncbi:MAG: DUF2157 domain-containing protein [Spirochaetes bacterium]|nr:DUF2157 domain-containing protein [Spirochaetota bacterium]
MLKNTEFIQQLFKELKEWVDRGIITSSQKIKIENLYSAPAEEDPPKQPALKDSAAAEKKSDIKDNINFARVIIGLAVLSLSVGIIIFYASNWRKMPPVFKLIQIFFVIIALYGGAYYFLQAKRKSSITDRSVIDSSLLIGRSLLLLGIISYGTGIMLVAQIYHISSHPANGLLAWAIGAYAMAVLMREKYSLVLSMLLFVIWDMWEYFYFANAAYIFGIPVILTLWFSFKIKEYRGVTASSILFSVYCLQLSIFWINHYAANGYVGYLMITGFIIAGLLMNKFGKELRKNSDLNNAGTVFLITGWIFYLIPFYKLVNFQPESSLSIIIWGSAVLIVSLLIRDKYGCYFSAFLFFLWSSAILTPATAYWYAIPLTVLAIIFYIEKDPLGIMISAVSFIYFYYYFTIGIADTILIGEEADVLCMIMMQFPLAAFLIIYGKIMTNHELLKNAGRIFNVFGWFSLSIPFILISWPMNMTNMPSLINFGIIKNCSIEYIVLSVAALAGLSFLILKKRNESIIFAAPVLFLGLLVFFLPFHHTATRMITLHLAAIGFIFLLLFYSYLFFEGKSFENIFAFIFAIGLIVIKGAGFIFLSYDDKQFKLAYLIGFILLVIICFLINKLADKMLSDRGRYFPVNILDVICAAAVWISVYLASFRVEAQRSIFEAQPVVIEMTFIFLALSVILYSILLKMIKKDRIILYLSLIIFISSGVILLTADARIPWEVYSFTFNLLLLIISAVYMYYSSIIKSKLLLNFATAAIVIHILTRYFDLFWDMFSGSLLFIITGIIGLAGGYLLEKKRGDISKIIKTSGEDKWEKKI